MRRGTATPVSNGRFVARPAEGDRLERSQPDQASGHMLYCFRLRLGEPQHIEMLVAVLLKVRRDLSARKMS
jgi:hypothetical protein